MSLSRNHNTVPGGNPQTLLWAVMSELFSFSITVQREGLHPNVWTVHLIQWTRALKRTWQTDLITLDSLQHKIWMFKTIIISFFFWLSQANQTN